MGASSGWRRWRCGDRKEESDCYAERVGLSTPIHVYDEVGLHPDETTIAEALRRGRVSDLVRGEVAPRSPTAGLYPTRHGFDEY